MTRKYLAKFQEANMIFPPLLKKQLWIFSAINYLSWTFSLCLYCFGIYGKFLTKLWEIVYCAEDAYCVVSKMQPKGFGFLTFCQMDRLNLLHWHLLQAYGEAAWPADIISCMGQMSMGQH